MFMESESLCRMSEMQNKAVHLIEEYLIARGWSDVAAMMKVYAESPYENGSASLSYLEKLVETYMGESQANTAEQRQSATEQVSEGPTPVTSPVEVPSSTADAFLYSTDRADSGSDVNDAEDVAAVDGVDQHESADEQDSHDGGDVDEVDPQVETPLADETAATSDEQNTSIPAPTTNDSISQDASATNTSGPTIAVLPYFIPEAELVINEWKSDAESGYRVIRFKGNPRTSGLQSLSTEDIIAVDSDDHDEEEEKGPGHASEDMMFDSGVPCSDMTEQEMEYRYFQKERLGAIATSSNLADATHEERTQVQQMFQQTHASFPLRIVYEKDKTGFEASEDFQIVIGDIVAGRYQILEYLGSAAFSKAIRCLDLKTGAWVCLKIIRNKKSFIDQSFDEIKLLTMLNSHDSEDKYGIVRLLDFFYYKEHLFLVLELLKLNLYEFFKYNYEHELPNYFTEPRLRRITRQILRSLAYVHSHRLIHCDLKPENILMKSISKCQVKLIDFGSSCFLNDHHTSYVQSRSYRAPEVILGCPYGRKIDMWSLGCILPELYTGNVLLQNNSIQALLARMISIFGPIPDRMLRDGKHVPKLFTQEKAVFEKRRGGSVIKILYPKRTSLAWRLRTNNPLFLDFVSRLLMIDPNERMDTMEALRHPWILQTDGEEEFEPELPLDAGLGDPYKDNFAEMLGTVDPRLLVARRPREEFLDGDLNPYEDDEEDDDDDDDDDDEADDGYEDEDEDEDGYEDEDEDEDDDEEEDASYHEDDEPVDSGSKDRSKGHGKRATHYSKNFYEAGGSLENASGESGDASEGSGAYYSGSAHEERADGDAGDD